MSFSGPTPALVLCAGWDEAVARDQAAALKWDVAEFAGRGAAMSGPWNVRKRVRRSGARSVVVFTPDLSNQLSPQLFRASLAACRVPCAWHDAASATFVPISPADRWRSALGLPVTLVRAVARMLWTGLLAAWMPRASRRPAAVTVKPGDSVVVIWPVRAENQVGGAVTHIAGIMRGFKECGLRVGLVMRGSPPPQFDGTYDDIETIDEASELDRVLPFTEMVAANREIRAAGERISQRIRPALVYQRHGPYLVAGSQLARSLDLPMILEVNGPAVWMRFNWRSQLIPGETLFRPLAVALERCAIDSATIAAAVSRNAAEAALAESRAKSGPMLLSPNAVDVDMIARIAGAVDRADGSGATVRLGWVGSFGPWHGAAVLIEAMSRLPGNVSALMVGSGGEFAACRQRVIELGLEERVVMPGFLPHVDAVSALAGCDILVSPHVAGSKDPFFGSPTKVFEFMALGLPIVASDLEQIGEVLEHGTTAVLVRPGDVDDLVRGIKSVMDLPDMGASLGEAAQREAAAEHTWARRAQDLLDALDGAESGRAR